MRHILLSRAPQALHQEAFGAWMNSRVGDPTDRGSYVASGDTLGEVFHDLRFDAAVTPWDLVWNRDYYQLMGQPGRELISALNPRRERVNLTEWVRDSVEITARPILYIPRDVNWTLDRRRYLPVLEEVLAGWGMESEYERVKLASNWSRRDFRVYNGSSWTPFLRQGTVSTMYTYKRHVRYYKALRRVEA